MTTNEGRRRPGIQGSKVVGLLIAFVVVMSVGLIVAQNVRARQRSAQGTGAAPAASVVR